MIAIIIGILITAFAIWVLWYGFKHFLQIFEVVFLLSIILFGYATMFFCIGIFGDKPKTEKEEVIECPIENEKDTSTYIGVHESTVFKMLKNGNGEFERNGHTWKKEV